MIALAGSVVSAQSEKLYGSFEDSAAHIGWEEQSRDPQLREHVQARVDTFSDAELAGAVLMPSFEKKVKPEVFGKLLCDIRARSYVILRSDTSKALVQSVQKAYTKACPKTGVTLMVALDAEPTLMKYRMPSIRVPNTDTLDNATNETSATAIAEGLAGAGIIFNFAPVYDQSYVVNRAKSYMSNRMYAEVTGSSSQKSDTFATIMWQHGIIPTAKHFPGHGEIEKDSHKQVVSIDNVYELNRFINASGHGVPVIMVGHIVVRGGEWDTGGLPSTLSSRIMTDLLRKKVEFHGLVVTDSMAMGALNKYSDRSVKALKAGADLIVIPPDPRAARARILKVMQTDSAFRERVRDAVFRAELLYAVRAAR